MKTIESPVRDLRVQRIAKKALALAPRGGVRNDVLVLRKLRQVSGQELGLEWWAREVHPWDRDLATVRQAELFSQQALHDTEAALVRLFQSFAGIQQIAFRVLDPIVSPRLITVVDERREEAFFGSDELAPWVILAGKVERDDVIPASCSQSIKMRLMMMGVRFLMVGDHLEPLSARGLWPMEG